MSMIFVKVVLFKQQIHAHRYPVMYMYIIKINDKM